LENHCYDLTRHIKHEITFTLSDVGVRASSISEGKSHDLSLDDDDEHDANLNGHRDDDDHDRSGQLLLFCHFVYLSLQILTKSILITQNNSTRV